MGGTSLHPIRAAFTPMVQRLQCGERAVRLWRPYGAPCRLPAWTAQASAVNVHFHPTSSPSLTLGMVETALDQGVRAVEFDLRERANGAGYDIVSGHDRAEQSSPTLQQVFQAILDRMGIAPTVQDDGYQFFLVLEPKESTPRMYEQILDILETHEDQLSTAVGPCDGPRPITVVMSGASTTIRETLVTAHGGDVDHVFAEVDRLFITEDYEYPTGGYVNLSGDDATYKWRSREHEGERGLVNDRHLKGVNLRTFFSWPDDLDDAREAFLAGSDEVNCDHDQVSACMDFIRSQDPRGQYPDLSIEGDQALLSWRGMSSNSIYVALGTADGSSLDFPRQLNLTWFLSEEPEAVAPAALLLADQGIALAYEGLGGHRLWTITGRLSGPSRFITLSGGEDRLTTSDSVRPLGFTPDVAMSPDGTRLLIVYEGTSDHRLWYV
jgi:hypothetical protein